MRVRCPRRQPAGQPKILLTIGIRSGSLRVRQMSTLWRQTIPSSGSAWPAPRGWSSASAEGFSGC
jgi:hypothetical protein